MANIVVPYLPCKLGDRGPAVRALRRALKNAGYGKLAGQYLPWGQGLSKLLRQFEIGAGLHSGGTATNAYVKATHLKLARYYDAPALKSLNLAQANTRKQKIRAAKVANCMYLYNIRTQLAYRQTRPWDRRKPPAALDCSGAKGWGDERAGAPSCGQPFGYGNTWTQMDWYIGKGAVRELQQAEPGDPVYYGRSITNTTHVADYLGRNEQGQDIVFSNGSYPCAIRALDYRRDRQAICNLLP